MEQVNVAIADDNERILDLLEEIINMDKELHVVGKAKNGEEMCQIIRNKQPDVVLLDLIMPKMDGLTVMEKINQDKCTEASGLYRSDSSRPGADYRRCIQSRRKLLYHEAV